MAKDVPQLVKASLRAVLLSSQKGIKQTTIEKDYHKLTNSRLDVKKYGFQDLYEFLLAVPDVARLEYSAKDGENKVFGVAEKGVFISDHAKKAEGIPNGLKPLPPAEWPRNKASKGRTVVENKSSLKVTVHSDSKTKIEPNCRGLYTLYIKNLPPDCQQSDINHIFMKFQTLVEVKLENSPSIKKRAAFVRFSNHAVAVQALDEMNGYKLKGFSLLINPGIERSSKVSKDAVETAKKKKNIQASESTLENKELTTVNSIKSTSPSTEAKTIASAENWETDGGLLSPKADALKDKFFGSQENLAAHIFHMDGGYPIHVSNFPAGTSQSTLKQLFSECGDIVRVEVREKFAFIYFVTKEEAVNALVTKRNKVRLSGKCLTVTPRTPKGASAMSQGSSQTSLISSCSSSTAQSPVNLSSVSDSTGLALGESNFYLMNTASIGGITVNTCRSKEMNTNFVDEKQGSCTSISKTSNSLPSHQEGRKVDGQILNTSSKAVAREGSIPSNTEPKLSVDVKQGVPLHTLLTYQEMSTLLKMCNKPLRTASSITFEEFDILVTDVVDSCHFWANVDDKSGSYKKLEQILADLQTAEHHKRCMPVRHQLGAALYSEDQQWYRCWCLEVTSLEKKEAKVLYIDFGNCEWISWDHFTDIHKRFWDLAPQAVPFKLAGLELEADLKPDILNEGSKYLSALICNKVCKARKIKPSDSSQPHVIEVELILNDERKTSVNKQMALTRYVHEERAATQATFQNPSVEQSIPASSQSFPSPNPEKHIPPHPFMKTQAADATHSALQPVQRSSSQEHLPAKKHLELSQKIFESTQSQSTQKLFESTQSQSMRSTSQSPQARQGGYDQQASQNAKLEHVTKSPQGAFQHEQSLPNQLFEKKEVIKIILSRVVSPDELCFFLADEKTKETLMKIQDFLKNVVDPKAAGCKIYPRKGDVVLKVMGSRRFRVKIISIPANAGYGIEKVTVKGIDYGATETVPLSALCELPSYLRDIPPQVKQAKLAGLRKKQGMMNYPHAAVNYLVALKTKREALQASIIKRDPDGLLHIELFGPLLSFPSLNVQLVKEGYAEIDPSQCPLSGSNRASHCLDDSKSQETQIFNNQPPTGVQSPGWHQPGLAEKKLDMHMWDTHSVHSDWEDSLIEIEEDWRDGALTGSHSVDHERQSVEQLYVPPPPDIHASFPIKSASTAEIRPPSAAGSANSAHSSSSTNTLYPDRGLSYSSNPSSNTTADSHFHHSANLVVGTNLNIHSSSTADRECHVHQHVRPPSPSTTSSDSSGVFSDASVNSLSSTESSLSTADKSIQDGAASEQSAELNSTQQDWRQEREELIARDEELKRLLVMPCQDMRKMINLRQEKEKLERKIRIKGLENQILKLQKELNQLEMERGELEGEING